MTSPLNLPHSLHLPAMDMSAVVVGLSEPFLRLVLILLLQSIISRLMHSFDTFPGISIAPRPFQKERGHCSCRWHGPVVPLPTDREQQDNTTPAVMLRDMVGDIGDASN